MTRRRPWAGSRFLRGVSLIELMISITIGLIIIGAVFSAYLGAAGASRMAEAQSRMDEDAQAALTVLVQQLRLAGLNTAQNWEPNLNYSFDTSIYNPIYMPAPNYFNKAYAPYRTPKYVDASKTPAFVLSAYAIRGCQGSFDNVKTANNLDSLNCVPDATAPNSFGVNYEADIYNTVPANSGGAALPTDCLGTTLSLIKAEIPQAAPASASTAPPPPAVYNPAFYYEADNRFFIDKPLNSDTPSLYCQGNGIGAVATPLVQNVEDMQITYGVQAPAAISTMVAGYLRADELLTQNGFPAGTTEDLRWKKVVTVRICLQMRSSATRVVSNIASASYLKCNGTLETAPPNDLRLRRTYTTTVVLRNRLL